MSTRAIRLGLSVALAGLLALFGSPAFFCGGTSGSGFGTVVAWGADKAEEGDFKDELPRIPPTEPADALAKFKLRPGFKIEQIAAEPLLHSPVAVAYDSDGRAYVVEMIDYSEQDKESLGAVRRLEDTNGDGVYDKSILFADKLSWPTAICCYDGGVFVGAAPDIYYLKDQDADGKADVRKTVYTGFGRSNVQGLFNSFHFGLDNRIHGAVSSSGAQVIRPDVTGMAPISLNGRDFSFDPKTLELRPESGGAQHGMCFDDFGRKFVCSNSDHIQLVMYEDRYIARNPSLVAPGPRLSIAADGPQAEVFRISPVEPWRIVRTRLRVTGKVPGLVEGGGRAAGYFTGATGVTLYRGDALPDDYRGQAFIGDVGSNIVHRKILRPSGTALIADRAEPDVEFVASTDIWFRPAQFANGPDGGLHIIDVCREVIEHPASLPPAIKKHLDLTSGRDRGRLYRVVADGFKQPRIPTMSTLTSAELVPFLQHRNAWHRTTAQRLLWERQDRTVVAALVDLARKSKLPEGRLHALWTLVGLNSLGANDVIAGINDPHAGVRRNSIRIAEEFIVDAAEVRPTLLARLQDDDLLVRYQLAFTLGYLPIQVRVDSLGKLLVSDGNDRWIRYACLSSLADGAGDVLANLLQNSTFHEREHASTVLAELATLVGHQARPADVSAVLAAIDQTSATSPALATRVVAAMSEGLTKANSPLRARISSTSGKAKELLDGLLNDAMSVAGSLDKPAVERAEAMRTLALGELSAVKTLLTNGLDNQQPSEVQQAALSTLARFRQREVGESLVSAWEQMSPRLRPAATEAIFSRADWLVLFLDAVKNQDIPASDIEPGRFRLLASHGDSRIQKLAEELKSRFSLSKRQDVITQYADTLKREGDIEQGRKHFQKHCSICHKLEGVGHEIGPNLATVQNRGAESILVNVLDPNREVNPQYVNYVLLNKAGKTMTGLISAETATSVTLRRQENQSDTVLRSEIDTLRSSGVSIMPEGLEKNLDVQALADVIAYLLSIR